jgi:hypothetical protein
MAMPSTNSSDGTVPNRAWHLTELSSFATGSFSNRRTLLGDQDLAQVLFASVEHSAPVDQAVLAGI